MLRVNSNVRTLATMIALTHINITEAKFLSCIYRERFHDQHVFRRLRHSYSIALFRQ